ncbi:hypothetical protein Leucomu_13245 [Leucobacter muris]|uniref:Helix-turn-helix domain-containing protein n=1 Tax=Leucobacter muris TaxID=1935379 RepID=A0ABX5QEK9_9MICO|nr:hypothetical protein [Leucobacter muris]QAB17141.1 hypothetical protein Leucomu_03675 [Leucobacter muris]QAB17502.1 hypothetical protein Leucomu_05815 [Leucobacter muris]QAB18344.1 hypothetical protein Leucomu_10815 [Leucobacter muris]QAB18747.1 hypothetical protein Leucomu_13245 [Leucobacter muris]
MTNHARALTAAADRLEQAHAARDAAILDAHAAKIPQTAIAAAVRLSRMQVSRIIAAASAAADQESRSE